LFDAYTFVGLGCDYNGELQNKLYYIYGVPVSGNKDDYIITQVITQYIKYIGYDGICYCSSLDKQGKNYLLFEEENIKFQKS